MDNNKINEYKKISDYLLFKKAVIEPAVTCIIIGEFKLANIIGIIPIFYVFIRTLMLYFKYKNKNIRKYSKSEIKNFKIEIENIFKEKNKQNFVLSFYISNTVCSLCLLDDYGILLYTSMFDKNINTKIIPIILNKDKINIENYGPGNLDDNLETMFEIGDKVGTGTMEIDDYKIYHKWKYNEEYNI